MSGFTTRTRPEAVGTPVSVVVNEWLSGRERAGRVDEVETGDISFLAQDEHVVPLGPPSGSGVGAIDVRPGTSKQVPVP